MTQNPKIGIIGGGLVGLTLALTLAKEASAHIAVFEKKPKPTKNTNTDYLAQYDARSIGLSSGSVNFFKSIDLWDQIEPFATPIRQILISRQGHWGRASINADEEGVEVLGYAMETPGFAQQLNAIAAQTNNIQIHWQADITHLKPTQQGYQVDYQLADANPETLSFDLLIIADGSHSQSCKLLGIDQVQKSYNQTAIVTNLDISSTGNQIAIERFIDRGVIALLPLNKGGNEYANRSALVWIVPNEEVDSIVSSNTPAFVQQLQSALGQSFHISRVGNIKAYPLSETITSELIRPNLLIMGNAAHALHPVAAQGFNLSIRDASTMLELISYAKTNQRSVGYYALLKQYQTIRMSDQRRVGQLIKMILGFYAGSQKNMPSLLQSAGLFLFDILPGSKGYLARFAMGAQQTSSKHQFKLSQAGRNIE